jgi:hypothetical protein
VPLGDTEALRAWADRENPPYRIWRLVDHWVLALDEAPWRAPSIPLTENAGERWEIRMGEVPDTEGVEMFYEHEHETGLVNLRHVGRPAS